jgi:hypothetical protein
VSDGRYWIAVLGCVVSVALANVTIHAEAGQKVATTDKPASIVATRGVGREANESTRLVLTVTGFKPPQNGAVQVVVKAEQAPEGTEREIGRFGIFPQTEFQAQAGAQPQQFGFPLPRELASNLPSLRLNVYLVPLRGDGRGSQVEIGAAALE